MIRRVLLLFLTLFLAEALFSQKKQTTEQYIEKYHKIAIKQMKLHKIPASITLAQGILESGNGNSLLATRTKNHFGIKCHSGWTGKRYYMDDDAKDECFRVYNSPFQSYEDHSLFLTNRGRYSFLFSDFKTTDYKKWAHGLKKAGYATNPKYPQLLINLIEKYELYQYDKKNFQIQENGAIEEDEIEFDTLEVEEYEIEKTDEYIKALMGRTVYYSDREKGIFIFNRIKTIKANHKTPIEIAVGFSIPIERLLKYNDIEKGDKFEPNQNVFLQPKRFNGSQKKYLVKPGDSMWDISQMFGIKLYNLYKKNKLKMGEEVLPGEQLYLRKKSKEKPKTTSYEKVLKTKKQLEQQKNIIRQRSSNKLPKKNVKQEEKIYPKGKYVEKNEEMIPTAHKEISTDVKTPKNQTAIHIVTQGETLYSLSVKYKVSVEEIKKWNNLSDNAIDIGQELIISQKEN